MDSSLLGVAAPYHPLAPDDPVMQATVTRVKADLHHPNGSGGWVLLAAWLGRRCSFREKADRFRPLFLPDEIKKRPLSPPNPLSVIPWELADP